MTLRQTLFCSALLACVACGGSQASGSGKMSVKMTDAPGDFQAAAVTITQINLQGAGGATVLSNSKTTVNLLKLQNDVSTLVQDAVVPEGTYTGLDLVISGGYVQVAQAGGGSAIYASSPAYEGLPAGARVTGTLQMPGFGQAGLKVSLPGGNVTVGTGSRVLLVDFDVQQSFGQQAGASGMWVLHPVMTATDFSLSGALDVSLAAAASLTLPPPLALGSFDAVLTNSAGSAKKLQLAAAAGASTATTTFSYLLPGSYTLSFAVDPSVSATATLATTPAIPAAVTVNPGAATQARFTLNSAQ